VTAPDPASQEAWAQVMRGASDESVRAPLWLYPPEARLAVIHERRVRFGVQEETGDPEYG
jgi:hypothetical protein